MTTRDVGTTLRLLGPALQVACLIGLFAAPGESAGRRWIFYAGFAAGLVMVLIGNILSRAFSRPPRSPSLDLRLGDEASSFSSERNLGSRET